MGDVAIEIWFPIDPLVFGIFLAVCGVFVVIWLWKLVVSLIFGT